jgi:uncharacterized membrane protein
MKSKAFSLLSFVVLLSVLSACNYSRVKGGGDVGASAFPALNPTEKASMMSFAFINEKIIQPKCISCHGAGTPTGVDLEGYDKVFNAQHEVHRTVFVDHTMPKRGQLTDEEQRLLWHWLNMGCPKEAKSGDANTPTPPVPVSKLIATFDSINKHIIQPKCVSCHSAGQDASRILLDKQSLLNSPLELVIPGDADMSGLVIAVERKDERRMPLATEGYGPLSDEEKKVIRDWVSNGAKD